MTSAAIATWSFLKWRAKPFLVPPDTRYLFYLYIAFGSAAIALGCILLGLGLFRSKKPPETKRGHH